MIETQNRIAGNLTALRKTADFSQEEVSQKLGLNQSAYASFESGELAPDIDILCKLAALYSIKLDNLINSDMQTVLEDFFFHYRYEADEMHLLDLYADLSDFSKGRLIEYAKKLAADSEDD